ELDYARQLPPVLHAHASGDLSLDHEGAHFRARQAVSAYAEAVGLDRYRITPESLAKLRVSGQGVEDLVARLRQLCINELAPLFEAKLRAWLGAAGRVEVSQPLLAKFDDAVIAGLLARSPEVEEFFGQALSLSAFALEPSQEAALTEFLKGLSCELAESRDLGALQRTQGFAHVIERPANAREGFSAVAFQDAKRKSLGAALSYATPFGATLVVKATSAGVKEATAMLAKRFWWDGRDGVFEADGKYGHQHFVLPLAAIELLEVAP
ncbi:MAG: hypothetical protein KDB07_05740, partial [Planctomycetes bacterium]|nr:hypothetical protein [Planctomycetota bacterium]